MLALAILTSGNNYSKMALWAQHMNLHFVSATTFTRIQRTYLVPVVDQFWEEHKSAVLQGLRDSALVVLGL